MTFDFIIHAYRDKLFMKQLQDALSSAYDSEICTDIHRLRYNAEKQTVLIEPRSEDSPFHWKVIPAEITYQALSCMLADKWEELKEEDIRYLD